MVCKCSKFKRKALTMIYPVLGGGRYYNPSPTNLAEKIIVLSRYKKEKVRNAFLK